MNVDGEMRSKWQRDGERVSEPRGGKGRESAWIPLRLTARVLILHAGCTLGVQGTRKSVGDGQREGKYKKKREGEGGRNHRQTHPQRETSEWELI